MTLAHRSIQAREIGSLLRLTVLTLALAPLFAVYAVDSPVPLGDRFVAGVIWALALLPSWITITTPAERRSPIPFLPLVGVLYGAYYALPIALGAYDQHWRIRVDPRTDYSDPLRLVLLGWIALLLGYRVMGAQWRVRPAAVHRVSAQDDLLPGNAAIAMTLVGLAAFFIHTLADVPLAFRGVTQFGNVIYQLGIAILVTKHVRGTSRLVERLVFVGALALGILLAVGSGAISPLLYLIITVFFAVWVARRSLGARWTALLIIGVLSALLLKAVLGDFRSLTAASGIQSPVARAELMWGLVGQKVRSEGLVETLTQGRKATARRSANIELLSDVMRRTPDEVPSWDGETYLSLVGVAIPRFLWPTKPTKELGQAFGHRYNYLDSSDLRTSFNFPFLVEFYANFGSVGVLLGMLIVGAIYRGLDNLVNRPGQKLLMSFIGLVLLLPLFNIESDFSLIFGGLVLNGAALWLLLRAVAPRRMVRPELERVNGLPIPT